MSDNAVTRPPFGSVEACPKCGAPRPKPGDRDGAECVSCGEVTP